MRYFRISTVSAYRLLFVVRNYGATFYNYRTKFALTNVSDCRQWRSYSDEVDIQPLVKCNDLQSSEITKLLSHFDELLKSDADTFDIATFATVCEKLCPIVSILDDHQLQNLCRSIFSIRQNHSVDKTFIDACLSNLVVSIDLTFSERAINWSNHTFLEFFQCFSYLPMPQRSQFTLHVMKKRLKMISREKPSTVVEFVRLMNKIDIWHYYFVPKFHLESFLYNHLSELDTRQIAIILSATCKLQHVFNLPESIPTLVNRMLEELPKMTDEDRITFLKFMRFIQFHSQHIHYSFVELITRVVDHLKNVDLTIDYYIEAAYLCTLLCYNDSQFFDILCSKFIHQLPDLTYFQCARIVYSLTYFDEHYRFVNVLKSCVEDESFSNRIFECPYLVRALVKDLTVINVYPYRIIDRMFSDEFLRRSYGPKLKGYLLRKDHVLGAELLAVDCGLEIERADYNGNRLDPEIRQRICKYYCWTLPSLLTSNPDDNEKQNKNTNKTARWYTKVVYRTKLALDCLFNDEKSSHVCYLLPHLPRPNVLFGIDAKGTPAKLPDTILNSLTVHRNILDNDLTWFTCAAKKRNKARTEDMLIADEITKVRQLIKLGFEVILLPSDWLSKNDDERKSYLNSYIAKKLNGEKEER